MLAGVYVSSVFLGWDYHIWVMQIALGPWQVGWLYLVNQWRLYEENSDLYIFSENVLERLTELTNWHKNIDFTQCIGIQHVLIICLFFEKMFLKTGGQILLQSITWDIWGVEFFDIFRRNEILLQAWHHLYRISGKGHRCIKKRYWTNLKKIGISLRYPKKRYPI